MLTRDYHPTVANRGEIRKSTYPRPSPRVRRATTLRANSEQLFVYVHASDAHSVRLDVSLLTFLRV